jgi:hypothetical protein
MSTQMVSPCIGAFALPLASQEAYAQHCQDCSYLNGDADGNGTVDFDDIDPFVTLLSGGWPLP